MLNRLSCCREVLGAACERRGIDLTRVEVLDSSSTLLPLLTTETCSLGGRHLRVTSEYAFFVLFPCPEVLINFFRILLITLFLCLIIEECAFPLRESLLFEDSHFRSLDDFSAAITTSEKEERELNRHLLVIIARVNVGLRHGWTS